MQVNADFACDFLTTLYHEQVLEAIVTLATSDIPCPHNDQIATAYLQEVTCDSNMYLIENIFTSSCMRCQIKDYDNGKLIPSKLLATSVQGFRVCFTSKLQISS